MTQLDWLYLALITVVLAVDHFVFTAMFLRRSAADPDRSRWWLWSMFLGLVWLLTAVGVLLWTTRDRAWATIALSVPAGWRLWGSVAIVLVVALLQARGAFRVAKSIPEREEVRKKLGALEAMLPRTGARFRLYVAASLTAGIGEEFIFRGYLIWAFNHWLEWWVAAAASLAVFSVAHSYQGLKGVLHAWLAGFFLTLVVAISRSLLPAMALHALVDLSSGYMAWLALRSEAPRLEPAHLGETS
jgi:membrane protease YdiL (CAAX protease family)